MSAAEAVVAKGKAEPVEAWVAVAPRSIVPEQARVGGLPLVGRDAEAEMLRGALGSCRVGSRRRSWCRSSVSRGSARRGWSRSCSHTSEELPELITWRRGRSLAYGEGVAFWALGEMVKAQAGILESDAARCRRDEARRGGRRR